MCALYQTIYPGFKPGGSGEETEPDARCDEKPSEYGMFSAGDGVEPETQPVLKFQDCTLPTPYLDLFGRFCALLISFGGMTWFRNKSWFVYVCLRVETDGFRTPNEIALLKN